MNIIYITASLPYGPAEPFSVPEIEGLRRIGHRVIVVPMHPTGQMIHVADTWLMDVIAEGLISPRIVWAAIAGAAKSGSRFFRVTALIGRSRSLVVLAKNVSVLLKGIWLAEMARRLRADHIHANWASCPATIALIASELSDIPWSFTGHRVDIQGDNLLSLKAERANFVRFISENGRELARSAGSVVAAQKARVVHMGVALPELAGASSGSIARTRAQIVFCAANLVALKRHADLIHSVKTLHERGIQCELWLAGDGPLRATLQHLARALGLEESVRFLGQLPHDEVIEIYRSQAIACAVLASSIEGIPVSLMEAMSFGIPVVATEVGGVPELLSDGCGVIVPPRNPGALADGIARVLTDETFRRAIAQAGRLRIESEYAADKNAEALSALFLASSVRAAVV